MIIEIAHAFSAVKYLRFYLVTVDMDCLTGNVFVCIVCMYSTADLEIGDVPYPMGEIRTLE